MSPARSRAYRTVAGFVVAPMMPALILAAVVLAAGGDSQTLGYAAFAGYVSYPFALLVGLPSFLVMRRKRWDGWRAYAVAGLVLGLVFLALFAALVAFDGEKAELRVAGPAGQSRFPAAFRAGLCAGRVDGLLAGGPAGSRSILGPCLRRSHPGMRRCPSWCAGRRR